MFCQQPPGTIYFDWSRRRKVLWIIDDDDTPHLSISLAHMLDDLPPGKHRIIGEATFASFRLQERQDFIDMCAKKGHELLTVPTRNTTRSRVKAGFSSEKRNTVACDLEDAITIRQEVQRGVHPKEPKIYDPHDPVVQRRLAANRELQLLRAAERPIIGPKGGLKGWRSRKDDFADHIKCYLPPYDSLPWKLQLAMGDDDYSLTIVAAVGICVRHCTSSKQFEQLAGLFNHGYGCQIRSDLMFHGWAGPTGNKLNIDGKRGDITLTDYRRGLRWLYGTIKRELGIPPLPDF